MARLLRLCVLLGASLGAAPAVRAHVASNGFVELAVQGTVVSGSVELAVRDVELAIGVDANRDGKVTWGEVRAATPRLLRYLGEHLSVADATGACPLSFAAPRINARVDGNYVWVPLVARCRGALRPLRLGYRALADVDPSHRALLTLTAGRVTQTAVLGGANPVLRVDLEHPARGRAFLEYLQAGLWHIWSGIDHLLFLLSLLLPAVLVRRQDRWQPVAAIRPAFLDVLKVVTAFTVAHSITLSLAAFDVLRLPSRLTESVIAASIVVAALNNVFPLVTEARARIAFAFGLLHGFGFASVLAEMGLPSGARLVSLVAFNLGIEAGQLAVVLAVMPCIYALRTAEVYRRRLLPLGSAAIAVLASVWFVQRALGNG